MSYDINFWKQERPLNLSPEEIYGKLCDGEPVEGLAKLPVDQILARLKQAFPDFNPAEKFTTVQTSEGSIEISWSDRHFRFDIRGVCAECQKLVEVMREFDCPMYDPQVDKRHDANGGIAVGETPHFADTAPEQKAKMERIMQEALAKSSGVSQKKGCGGAAVILCVLFFALVAAIWRLFV